LKKKVLQFIELEEYIDFMKTRLEYDMPFVPRFAIIFTLGLLLFTTGCYNKPVRHLASDAVLIEAGTSTRQDVLTYLGEPDIQRRLPSGEEEWIYIEEMTSDLQRVPLAGGYFEGKGQERILIVLSNDIVQSCEFREFGTDEFDWSDTYSPQEKTE